MNNHYKNAKFLATLLENKFSFLGFRFGLDPLLGLIPFLGDAVALFLSAYIIWIAHNSNIPSHEIARMWRNVIFDFILGLIPFVGDISDFFYKASSKNLQILEKYASRTIIDAELVS